jgi:hypothetical protein
MSSKLSVLSSLKYTANFQLSLVILYLSSRIFSTFSISDFSNTEVLAVFQGICINTNGFIQLVYNDFNFSLFSNHCFIIISSPVLSSKFKSQNHSLIITSFFIIQDLITSHNSTYTVSFLLGVADTSILNVGLIIFCINFSVSSVKCR